MICEGCDATFLAAAMFGTDQACPFCGEPVPEDDDD